ncbi:MAG: DUF481 domain-containing protein [Bacteroidota bacterium]
MVKRFCFLIIVFLFLSEFLGAQIMNIEKLRLESDSGWVGKVKGSYNINKSSSKVKQLQTNVHIQYVKDVHTFLVLSDISFIKAGEENFENNGSQHFRYTRNMTEWMSLEGFTQFQYNRILKVAFRNLWGGGVRFEAFDKDEFKLYLGNIMMYEHERLENKDTENSLRLSYYINTQFEWDKMVSLQSIIYFQPKMFKMIDHKVLWQSNVEFSVLDNLKLGIQYNWMKDSRPPDNVPKVIYSLRNTVSYSF